MSNQTVYKISPVFPLGVANIVSEVSNKTIIPLGISGLTAITTSGDLIPSSILITGSDEGTINRTYTLTGTNWAGYNRSYWTYSYFNVETGLSWNCYLTPDNLGWNLMSRYIPFYDATILYCEYYNRTEGTSDLPPKTGWVFDWSNTGTGNITMPELTY